MGLDPVQNLSKSGLKPDYDDQESKSNRNPNQIKIYDRTLVEILGNPGRNPERIGNPGRIPVKIKKIYDKS